MEGLGKLLAVGDEVVVLVLGHVELGCWLRIAGKKHNGERGQSVVRVIELRKMGML